jgi:hypothetical protein
MSIAEPLHEEHTSDICLTEDTVIRHQITYRCGHQRPYHRPIIYDLPCVRCWYYARFSEEP